MANGPALVIGEQLFPLSKVTNTVGRKDRITNIVPDVDLSTADQDRSVSRKHAELGYANGTVSVRDLGSTNGTTVNGEPLTLQVDRALADGDTVTFGGVAAHFRAAADWPEGVEAEWAVPEAPTVMASAEETAILTPDQTFVMPPAEAPAAEAEAPAAEAEATAAEAAPADDGTYMGTVPAAQEPAAEAWPAPPEAPAGETWPAPPEAPAGETWPAPAEAPAGETWPAPAEAPAAEAHAAAPEPEPQSASQQMNVYVACSNHPHLPAIALCPGCLEPFCVDCLPDRGDAPLSCNRCAGISFRLAPTGA